MSYGYGYGQNPPPKKDNSKVWENIFSGVDKFFTLKTTKEQQKLAELQIKQLQEQGKITAQQAQIELSKIGAESEAARLTSESATEQFLAKIKANKAVLVPLAIAGSLAIAGVGYYYFKKAKKG